MPNLGHRGAVTWVIWYFAKKLCTRHDAWAGTLSWWSYQSPGAHSCDLLNHPDSFAEESSSLTQNVMQMCYSNSSVILNAMATQYTCSLSGVYSPHWLVQWSRHCSHMRIPAHSPWLPGYIDVTLTFLVILTMVGLFLERPRICIAKMCMCRGTTNLYMRYILNSWS